MDDTTRPFEAAVAMETGLCRHRTRGDGKFGSKQIGVVVVEATAAVRVAAAQPAYRMERLVELQNLVISHALRAERQLPCIGVWACVLADSRQKAHVAHCRKGL